MGNRHISRDLKLCALRLYDLDILSLHDILTCVGFSRRTFFRIHKLWTETGDVVKPRNRFQHRPRKLHFDDLFYLLRLIRQRPDWFVDELLCLLEKNRFISVHYTTIIRELARAGVSRKKLKKIAKERNETVRLDYIREVSQYTPEQLGFLDEVSKDERTTQQAYGRSRRGQRSEEITPFIRGRRLTVEGLLTIDGMVTSHVVEGSMTRELYLEFLEHEVMPLCSPFPGKLSVLIMDNAKIHHGDEIHELVGRYGVQIVYLPPYSPDLNPIEEAFSQVKHFIRRNGHLLRGTKTIFYDMYIVMDIVGPEDAMNYFIHAGYV